MKYYFFMCIRQYYFHLFYCYLKYRTIIFVSICKITTPFTIYKTKTDNKANCEDKKGDYVEKEGINLMIFCANSPPSIRRGYNFAHLLLRPAI